MNIRIGQGYDIHKLTEGRDLILGGVKVPHSKGILAYSDGDVLVHAVIDSILGAMGEKDIGTFFPDNDSKYKGANSLELLNEIVILAKNNGYKISNIDTTIIAQEPKLAPYIDEIKSNLASTLGIKQNQISVKAKTNEEMDSVGKRESIIAQAVVLLVSI